MWNTLLGINSFVFFPASFIFFIYSIGRLLFFGDWKLFVTAMVVFIVSMIAGTVFAILSE